MRKTATLLCIALCISLRSLAVRISPSDVRIRSRSSRDFWPMSSGTSRWGAPLSLFSAMSKAVSRPNTTISSKDWPQVY